MIPAQSRDVLAIVASTNPACAQNTTPGAACVPGPITLAYYSDFGDPLDGLAAPGGSMPAGGDTAISGWVRGACSSGKPSTTDGPPSDSSHSYGYFNLGHQPYVQAMGTSATTPLAAGSRPCSGPPTPPGTPPPSSPRCDPRPPPSPRSPLRRSTPPPSTPDRPSVSIG